MTLLERIRESKRESVPASKFRELFEERKRLVAERFKKLKQGENSVEEDNSVDAE